MWICAHGFLSLSLVAAVPRFGFGHESYRGPKTVLLRAKDPTLYILWFNLSKKHQYSTGVTCVNGKSDKHALPFLRNAVAVWNRFASGAQIFLRGSRHRLLLLDRLSAAGRTG